jgi:hypothetical protein
MKHSLELNVTGRAGQTWMGYYKEMKCQKVSLWSKLQKMKCYFVTFGPVSLGRGNVSFGLAIIPGGWIVTS